jgi:hypothetical protein
MYDNHYRPCDTGIRLQKHATDLCSWGCVNPVQGMTVYVEFLSMIIHEDFELLHPEALQKTWEVLNYENADK